MNRLFLLAISFLCAASFTNDRIFTVEANISGLQINDTVLIIHYKLPFYDRLSTDTLLITVPGEFEYTGECEGSRLFGFEYHPLHGSYEGSPSRISVFIGSGAGDRHVVLDGTAEYFTLCRRSGGCYNNKEILALNEMEDSLNLETIRYYRKFLQFGRIVGRPENKNYNKDSADFYLQRSEEVGDPRLKEMTASLISSMDDNEYAAYLYLGELLYLNDTTIQKRYDCFSEKVKNSNTGKVLASILAAKKNIRVGMKPADFTVTDSEKRKIRLSDYRGKYLLIYHWGLCPATIWIQPQILALYDRYKGKPFEILGFTGINLEESEYAESKWRNSKQLAPLFRQPWTTVFTFEKENQDIREELYFSAVPILMLVSPDGTTLLRGYTEVYEALEKILEEAFPENVSF